MAVRFYCEIAAQLGEVHGAAVVLCLGMENTGHGEYR